MTGGVFAPTGRLVTLRDGECTRPLPERRPVRNAYTAPAADECIRRS